MNADPGEEVALSKSSKLIWADIFDAPFVHDARGDHVARNQFAQPCRGEWVDLVVVGGGHRSPPPHQIGGAGGGCPGCKANLLFVKKVEFVDHRCIYDAACITQPLIVRDWEATPP